MNDVLVLRSAISLMDSGTTILWSNKYILPHGCNYNDEGYVITNEPRAMIKACIGLSFGFLIGKLGRIEYVRQNAIALRLLNPDVHKAIVSTALWYALRKSGFSIDRGLYDKVLVEVYELTTAPPLNGNFISFRRTWFRQDCDYNTIAKVVRLENANKIDSDRELMTIDTKYLTKEVAEFTGFSRSRIDKYWKDKDWTKSLRSLYTLDEAVTDLAKIGIDSPTREQLASISGLSISTISRTMKELTIMVNRSDKSLPRYNDDGNE
jgi:hypothetical protein